MKNFSTTSKAMTITPDQRLACICKMAVAIAKHEGWELSESSVLASLDGSRKVSQRTTRWTALAIACFDAVESTISSPTA